MRILTTVPNAARKVKGKVTAPTGHVFEYDPNLDSMRSTVLAGISPSRIAAVTRAADDGDITDALDLFDEMERSDSRLFAVANTRRLALTGLDWEIKTGEIIRPGHDFYF